MDYVLLLSLLPNIKIHAISVKIVALAIFFTLKKQSVDLFEVRGKGYMKLKRNKWISFKIFDKIFCTNVNHHLITAHSFSQKRNSSCYILLAN